MTTRIQSKNKQGQQQIPFGDDNPNTKQEQARTTADSLGDENQKYKARTSKDNSRSPSG
jgi:hypothetical protein